MPSIETLSIREKTLLNKDFDTNQIYVAKVMDVTDFENDGSIMVYILYAGHPTDKEEYWVKAYHASSFYGTTTFSSKPNDSDCPTSFGLWGDMPYVGNYVFIFYPRMYGQNVRPYWFACPVDNDFDSMLPGMANEFNSENGEVQCEKIDSKKRTFEPLQKALKRQGLDKDKLRGITTSSSKREKPSKSFGFLSPLGHQFVIDDGWSEKDKELNKSFKTIDKTNDKVQTTENYHDRLEWGYQLDENYETIENQKNLRYNGGFRFRTRNGTQVLISDSGDIYAINSDGTAWAEISHSGHLYGYSKNGVDISSDGNINLHTKQNVNIDCDGVLSLRAKEKISIETPKLDIRAGQTGINSSLTCKDVQAVTGNIGSLISASAQINGTFAGTLNGTAYYATCSGNQGKAQPIPQIKLPIVNDSETSETNKNQLTDISTGEIIDTICTVVPTHEPWGEHNYNDSIPSMNPESKVLPKKEIKEAVTTKISNTIKGTK